MLADLNERVQVVSGFWIFLSCDDPERPVWSERTDRGRSLSIAQAALMIDLLNVIREVAPSKGPSIDGFI
jgi:hypothetical protein